MSIFNANAPSAGGGEVKKVTASTVNSSYLQFTLSSVPNNWWIEVTNSTTNVSASTNYRLIICGNYTGFDLAIISSSSGRISTSASTSDLSISQYSTTAVRVTKSGNYNYFGTPFTYDLYYIE